MVPDCGDDQMLREVPTNAMYECVDISHIHSWAYMWMLGIVLGIIVCYIVYQFFIKDHSNDQN